jgi:hypothetical protein
MSAKPLLLRLLQGSKRIRREVVAELVVTNRLSGTLTHR